MKHILPILVVFACCVPSAEATLQEPERLLYNGRTYPTPVHPLESCPTVDEEDLHNKGGIWSSGNLRGYVATWEVAENKLWLTDIDTWLTTSPRKTPIPNRDSLKKATLDDLFPGEVVDGRVHAKWFTGLIYCPGLRWGSELSGEQAERLKAEARLFVHVSRGVVHKIEACVIACYGDSITAGAHLAADKKYPAILQTILPDAKVHNFGIGGNTSSQGRARLEKALDEYKSALLKMYTVSSALTQAEKGVLRSKPDLVVLLFGTNDSVLTAAEKYRVPVEKYRENLREMVLRCRKDGTETILCTLLPIIPDPYYTRHPKEFYDAEGGLEKILLQYHAAAVEVGEELKVPVVDLYKVFQEDLTLLRPAPDGVHPNARGAKVIAEEIAKLLTAERKPVPLEKVRAEDADER